MPLPIELALMVGAILVSRRLDLAGAFHVRVVAEVPEGMPAPSLPRLDVLATSSLWTSVLSIAVVAFVVGGCGVFCQDLKRKNVI